MNYNAPSFTPNYKALWNSELNQTTVFLMLGESMKKDAAISSLKIEIQKLQNAFYNEISSKNQVINDLVVKNNDLTQKNSSLLSDLDTKTTFKEKTDKQFLYSRSKQDLINQISETGKLNRVLKEKIIEVEKKCELMEETIREKDRSINECIDAIFLYEMKCSNLNKNDL